MAEVPCGLIPSLTAEMALRERPPNLRPKASNPGGLDLQPREAKIYRDTSLMDIATFLRDTPAPMNSSPVPPKSEDKALESSISPHNSLVRRVFKVRSRLSMQSNVITQGRSRPTGLEFGQSASAADAHESHVEREAIVSVPPAAPKQVVSASGAKSSAEPSMNPTPNLANLLGEDVHAMYVTWLDNEMASNQQRSLAVRKPEPIDAESPADMDQNQQSREETKLLSHAVDDNDRSSRREALNGEGQTQKTMSSVSANNQAPTQDSTKVVPKRRSGLFANAPGPTSPPPQKPLPPTPLKILRTDDRKDDTKDNQSNIAQRILDLRQMELEDHHRRESRSSVSSRPQEKSPHLRGNIVREDSNTILISHNMTNSSRHKESDMPAETSEAKPVDAMSLSEVIDRASEAPEFVTPPETALASPVTETNSLCALSTNAKNQHRKLREGRTRARKLKHIKSDSKSTTTTELLSPAEEFSETPFMLKKKTSRPEPLDLSKCRDNKTENDSQGSSDRPHAENTPVDADASPTSSSADAFRTSLSASESVASTMSATPLETPSTWPSGFNLSVKTPPISIQSLSRPTSSVTTPARSLFRPEIVKVSNTNQIVSKFQDQLAENLTATSNHVRAPSTASSNDPSARHFNPDADGLSPSPHLTSTKISHSKSSASAPTHKHHKYRETPPLSPQLHPSSRGTPSQRDLHARVAHLERENKLLEAALMAVLKTNGSLNRCPCPCNCGANDAALNSPGLPSGASSRGAVQNTAGGYAASDVSASGSSSATAVAGVVEPKSGVPTSREVSEPADAAGNRSSAAERGGQATASLRGAGGTSDALELYMQTRRASGFDAAARRAA